LPEKFFDSARYANLQNYFARLTPPIIINPGFRALYLARQNEFPFFPLINTNVFHFWLLVSTRKI